MKTVVITGGTRGIGRGLALQFLSRGHRVIAIGSDAANGQGLLDDATRQGGAERVSYLHADLSAVAATTALAGQLAEMASTIDTLVLCAGRLSPGRVETAEGFEQTFALYVMNRYLLGEQLRGRLERAERPIIFNVCGTGSSAGAIQWDDLQLLHRYSGLRATMQAARANDLVGLGFTLRHPDSRIRYILHNPMLVDTGQANQFGQPVRTVFKVATALFGDSVDDAIKPMIRLMTDPPAQPLSAFRKDKPVDVTGKAFSRDAALRLRDVLDELTTGVTGTDPVNRLSPATSSPEATGATQRRATSTIGQADATSA